MRQYFHAFWMCQSMFCAIPCPVSVWDEDARDKMLLFLPVVGLEIGVIWSFFGWLVQFLEFPELIRGIILCVCPFVLTGYIHLDGYMDVLDAVKSCRNLQRRREILKDSHVGAFAVIGCVMLMLAQFAFCACLADAYFCLMLIPVVSRCLSALAIQLLKPMSTSQYSQQHPPKFHIAVLCLILLGVLVTGFLSCGLQSFALVVEIAAYGCAVRKGYRALEGMNGDISGYALTICELSAAACLALL